jgi:hypothetical protein
MVWSIHDVLPTRLVNNDVAVFNINTGPLERGNPCIASVTVRIEAPLRRVCFYYIPSIALVHSALGSSFTKFSFATHRA